jgi:hypothetical protein
MSRMISPTKAQCDLSVAREIQRQLGNKAIAMLGANLFTGDHNSLSFSIGGNDKGVNRVKITLNGNDYYDLDFYYSGANPWQFARISSEQDVCVENLHEIIEEHTGMRTSL